MSDFRWANCYADVLTYKHDMTIKSYFDDVIVPALATLDTKIADLGASEEPWHAFACTDMEEIRQETKLAFGLSIQSIWERQLRTYLVGCARELRPNESLEPKLEKANWKDLRKSFRVLRGIEIECFPSWPELDLLHHLGNACRHGDGESALLLADRLPELWPRSSPPPPGFDLVPALRRRVAAMEPSPERLAAFVDAIAAFWRDIKLIYEESLGDPQLDARLTIARRERGWTPQAARDTKA